MNLGRFNIIINNNSEFEKVQDILFSLGYVWTITNNKRHDGPSFKYPVYIRNIENLIVLNFYFEEYKLIGDVYSADKFSVRFIRSLKIGKINKIGDASSVVTAVKK